MCKLDLCCCVSAGLDFSFTQPTTLTLDVSRINSVMCTNIPVIKDSLQEGIEDIVLQMDFNNVPFSVALSPPTTIEIIDNDSELGKNVTHKIIRYLFCSQLRTRCQ